MDNRVAQLNNQRQQYANDMNAFRNAIRDLTRIFNSFQDSFSEAVNAQDEADEIFLSARNREPFDPNGYLQNMEIFYNTYQEFVRERNQFIENIQLLQNRKNVVAGEIRSMDRLQRSILGINNQENIEDLMGQLIIDNNNNNN